MRVEFHHAEIIILLLLKLYFHTESIVLFHGAVQDNKISTITITTNTHNTKEK